MTNNDITDWCLTSVEQRAPAFGVGRSVELQIVGVRGPDKAVLSATLTINGIYPDRFLLPGTVWPTPRREHWV